MVYFSQQEFLAAEARRTQMEVRGKTTPLPSGVVHPPEHERQRVQNLLDSIPETQPGPNAFARPAEMVERKKTQRRGGPLSELEPRDESVGYPVQAVKVRREATSTLSNPGSLRSQLPLHSGYQTALSRSHASPPAVMHPALRNRSVSDPPTPPRDSDCTNFTEFIVAGREASPKLKLNATPNPGAEPTFRARVEDRTEQEGHVRSGDGAERVPVFHPTPKMSSTKEFTQRPSTPADLLTKDDTHSKQPVKTPKKGLLAKLKLSTNSRSANSSIAADMPSDPADQLEEKVPVKAQALLGESSPRGHKHRASLGPSPTKMLVRSPSKRNKFFSRKNVEQAEPVRPATAGLQTQRPHDEPSMFVTDAPQTAISDPTHFSYDGRRAMSRIKSEDVYGKQGVEPSPKMTRSKSVTLKHFDGLVPPTPPAKNTPPHEKAMKEAREVEEMQHAMKMSATEQRHCVRGDQRSFSGDAGNTPTRLGVSAFREYPALTAKPSMYSLHASVIPDEMEASTMEEMEARIGGLDIEGFNSPTDRIVSRSNIHEAVYSPSIYSLHGGFGSPRATPMPQQEEQRGSAAHASNPDSFSSSGTITIVYPDLSNDPSHIEDAANREARNNADTTTPSRGRATHLSPELTSHGRTHSRDHLDSDQQAIFAQHVDNEQQRNAAMYKSPSSFSHMSAMPSPLHYLPATTYVPPPPNMKKGKEALLSHADVRLPTSSSEQTLRPARGSGLGIQATGSVVKKQDEGDGDSLFAVKPSRPGTATIGNVKSLQNMFELSAGSPAIERGNGQKAATVQGPPGDRFDVLMELLDKRHAEMNDMREELLNRHSSELSAMREELRQEMRTSNTSSNDQSGAINKLDLVLDLLNKRNSELNEMREQLRHSAAARSRASQQATTLGGIPTDKLDRVLGVLNTRNDELEGMREEVRKEMYENQTELDQGLQQAPPASPPITPATTVSSGQKDAVDADTWAKRQVEVQGKRVSTEVAHEFYRSTAAQEEARNLAAAGVSSDGGAVEVDGTAGSSTHASVDEGEGGDETIRQLQKTNRKLLEMVAGFAGKLEALEAKVAKGV